MIATVILSFSTTLSMFIFVGLLWGVGSAFFYPASMAHAFEYAGSSGGTAVGTIRALMDLGSSPWANDYGHDHPPDKLSDNVSLLGPYMPHQSHLFSGLCEEKKYCGAHSLKGTTLF